MNDNAKPTFSIYLVVMFGILYILSHLASCLNTTSNESIAKIIETRTSQENTFEGDIQAVEYRFNENKKFNRIVTYENKGARIFAFRMETDVEVGNGGNYFNYEIGRIVFNQNNTSESICTFNARADYDGQQVKWFENCSESKFLKNLNTVADLKREEFNILKPMYQEERIADNCGMYGSEDDKDCEKYNKMSDSEFDSYFKDLERKKNIQLAKLRNTTIENLK